MALLAFSRQLRNVKLSRSLRTQPIVDNTSHEHSFAMPPFPGLANPRQLVKYLDQFVIGQERAKRVLAVAVFNHYNRVRANMSIIEAQQSYEKEVNYVEDPDTGVHAANVRPLRRPPFNRQIDTVSPYSLPLQLFEKSNVLVIGPTGSGKTLLAKTLAKVLDVPFSVSDATSFTQAGYVGEDVDMAVQRLLMAANWDPLRASMGIVYIDEVDKIAKRAGSGIEGSRDVAGEGVQQALLRMMEGSVVSVQAKGGAEVPPDPYGHPHQRAAAPRPDTYHIDTANVLFILSGAFVGLDDIIRQRVSKASIGFTSSKGDETEMPLPFFTPNRKTHNILDLVDNADLVKYGFIPEFISRLPSLTTLAPLTISDLRRVLTEVKGSLVSQYQALFGYSNVEIRFTSGALDEVCRKASERGGGARGLRGIMETLLLDPMFEVPEMVFKFMKYKQADHVPKDTRYVLITEDVVLGKGKPGYWPKGESAQVAFLERWVAEERSYKGSSKGEYRAS